MTPVPARTQEQRADALAIGNAVRTHRAGVKRNLTAQTALELIHEPGPLERTWKVADMLIHVPAIGRSKRDRILASCKISHAKTLEGLSGRQRLELSRAVAHFRSIRS